MDDLSGYVSDDELAISPLNALGWQVESVSWRSVNVDWDRFDVVVIRTTWDYHNAPKEFILALKAINRTSAMLENAISIVEWNVDKTYLKDLSERGCKIVPTIWFNGEIMDSKFAEWQAAHSTDELVLKPTISATAKDTFRLKSINQATASVLNGRGIMIQPFIKNIADEGEYSLFYFNGEYSHAIVKRPKQNDYRVQEEHGGIISSIEPDSELKHAAFAIQEMITPTPLYSRVDLVRSPSGEFWLMELELIEPSLYLRTDKNAPERFAKAIDNRANEL